MRGLSWLAAAVLLSAAPAAAAGSENRSDEAAPQLESLRLIVDHLPPFLYSGERLSFSFRVERAPGLAQDIPFRLEWSFTGSGGGAALARGEHEGRAAGRFTIVSGALSVPEKAVRWQYALSVGGRRLSSGSAMLLGEDGKWPEGAGAGWGGLAGQDGEALILTLEERVARADDRWKPLRWVWERGRAGASGVMVAGPRLVQAGGRGYAELLEKSAERFAFVELAETGGGIAPSSGIYRMVELVETEVAPRVAGNRTELVVLVMPQSDPEMATEPRRYRQGLDWLLSRLGRAGVKGVVLVPPLTRAVPARQSAAYAEACRTAAVTYARTVGARRVDVAALTADEGLWRPEGADGAVTGRFPNARGHEALAALIRAAYGR